MKNILKKTAFILFISALFFTACKKDDNSSSSANTSTIVTSGTWRVSYYHESGNDHTTNFSGYTFMFNSNGSMTAVKSGVTTTGTWSNDDSHNEFHMSLGNNNPLKDLSKGWLIISKTNTEIKLQDDNTAHTEELHFTKI